MPNQIVRELRRQSVADEEPADDWVERELAGCRFKDERLGNRFRTFLGQLAEGTGESIPMACQDWANTKAAYRFLSNDRVNEQEILAGHFEATHARFLAASGTVLVLHDTVEFCFRREDGQDIGYLTNLTARSVSRPQSNKVCGMLMHSSLAVTTEGLPWE